MYRPDTAAPLNQLVQTLLHDPHSSTLTPGERELIATYTSSLNGCVYCSRTHGAIAKHQLGGDDRAVACLLEQHPEDAPISAKLQALLRLAALVQQGGRQVQPSDIEHAKAEGATDREIHDAVLIAATFCLFNRYVDGLGTWAPEDPAVYEAIGRQRAQEGYLTKPFTVPNPA